MSLGPTISQIFGSIRPFSRPEGAMAAHLERAVGVLGGVLSIFAVMMVTRSVLSGPGQLFVIASMGSSAVLLFAVPHGPLSQPWNVFAGHILSAFVAVAIVKAFGNGVLAAGLAVGLAIGAMYYSNSIHPPGGATALTVVIGGPSITDLGFTFVAAPVAINALIMVAVAVIFNAAFGWRRYPLAWYEAQQRARHEAAPAEARANVTSEDIEEAIRRIGTYVDVSKTELLEIFDLATSAAVENRSLDPDEIQLRRYYTNGEFGDGWAVRQIIDEQRSVDNERDFVIYKTVAGDGRRTSAMMRRKDFAKWANFEVIRDENSWRRVT